MKGVVLTNDEFLRDSRDLVINLGDLVALATDGYIKTGRVIGFKPAVNHANSWTGVPPTVVLQCHGGYKPSFVRYSTNNLLCIERLGEGKALS